MEALALGRPVISTYVAGIPELVEQDVNGWLVPAGAVEPLANAMIAVLIAATIQQDDFRMYPDNSIMSGGSPGTFRTRTLGLRTLFSRCGFPDSVQK